MFDRADHTPMESAMLSYFWEAMIWVGERRMIAIQNTTE